MQWLSGHSGILANGIEDFLAKRGARQIQPATIITLQSAKKPIKNNKIHVVKQVDYWRCTERTPQMYEHP